VTGVNEGPREIVSRGRVERLFSGGRVVVAGRASGAGEEKFTEFPGRGTCFLLRKAAAGDGEGSRGGDLKSSVLESMALALGPNPNK